MVHENMKIATRGEAYLRTRDHKLRLGMGLRLGVSVRVRIKVRVSVTVTVRTKLHFLWPAVRKSMVTDPGKVIPQKTSDEHEVGKFLGRT